MINEINLKPAYTVAELASTRQNQIKMMDVNYAETGPLRRDLASARSSA